jgi:hypothetical protein
MSSGAILRGRTTYLTHLLLEGELSWLHSSDKVEGMNWGKVLGDVRSSLSLV